MSSIICPRCLLRTATNTARQARINANQPIPRSSTSPSSITHRRPSHLTSRSLSSARPQSQATPPPSSQDLSTQNTEKSPLEGSSRPPNAAPAAPKSCVPEGAPLRGLNYFKNKEDPIAMADGDYPDWLWTVLDIKKKSDLLGGSKVEVDTRIYSKSARTRQAANRRMRLQAAKNPELAKPKTPIYEQTVDLPSAGDASDAARIELQRAMRQKRKSDIKTTNFLKTMK